MSEVLKTALAEATYFILTKRKRKMQNKQCFHKDLANSIRNFPAVFLWSFKSSLNFPEHELSCVQQQRASAIYIYLEAYTCKVRVYCVYVCVCVLGSEICERCCRVIRADECVCSSSSASPASAWMLRYLSLDVFLKNTTKSIHYSLRSNQIVKMLQDWTVSYVIF